MENQNSLEFLAERIRGLFNCRVLISDNSCDGFYDLSIDGSLVDMVYCYCSIDEVHNILLHYLHAFNLLNSQK